MTDHRARLPATEGTGEPYTMQQPRIADRCPSCGSRSLFIGSGGWLTCSVIGCKEPGVTAALEARAAVEAAATATTQQEMVRFASAMGAEIARLQRAIVGVLSILTVHEEYEDMLGHIVPAHLTGLTIGPRSDEAILAARAALAQEPTP